MLQMILPVLLVVVANTFYHIISRKTPTDSNAFLSLAITYGVAALASFIFFFFSNHEAIISSEFKKLNWTSFALGIVIIGLELGYILTYRAGWDVSRAPLVANSCLAIVLVFVGAIVFREQITLRQIIGMAVCISGLVIFSI